MSWLMAVPILLVAAGWLLGPGLLLAYGLGLRGIAAWGAAPATSVATVSVLAVLAGAVGIAWSLPLAIVGCFTVAGAVSLLAFALRRRFPGKAADPGHLTRVAFAGLVPAVLLGALTLALGLRRPDQLSQTFDAVFHYNAVAYILDSRNASSMTMNGLGSPDVAQSVTGVLGLFYPAAWHDLTSLVVLATGANIPLATNMMSLVVAVVVWPLSCLLLVRQIFGPSRAALAVTGLLSVGFTAFPWGFLAFGVLWPNLMALALAPAGLAMVLSVCGLARDDVVGRPRAWFMLATVLVAGAFAETNVDFTLVVLSVFPAGIALRRRAARLRNWRAAAEIAVALVVFGLGWWFVATTPLLANVRTNPWPAFESPAQAVGQVMLNATTGPNGTNGFHALWALSVVVLVGVARCGRQPELRWVVGGWAISGALFVMAAAMNRPDTQLFTGYWYNDAYRLGAAIPVTAVPLAVAGVLYLARRWPAPRFALKLAATMVALLLLSKGLYVGGHASALRFRGVDALTGANSEGRLVDSRTQAFFARVQPLIPRDAIVAGNPWDGSTLLWALADRRTLFPHLGTATSPVQWYLAGHLDEAGTNPQVCHEAVRIGVGYLLIGDGTFWPTDAERQKYPGFADPAGKPGFQVLAEDGPHKLYRLAC
ncbi:DUF6541 family protein [Amycolatopsis pithecellobii]|uniref:Uncharacterized protein n=1 Tax=Amycolatopsis pithecellobii TaxID=664692 RepID=A0A6N7Z923_9PSEU|nr:DUF6541 family protein [Amycolatopsis pithecellobii]MTD57796.1 hypothetical protein [Amycolatopsis pithecellobii]